MLLRAVLFVLGAGHARGWTPPPVRNASDLMGGDLCTLQPAGLGDRRAYYSQMAGVVATWNATLYIPARPCDAFEYRLHGHFGGRDCNRTWSEYFALAPSIRPVPRVGKCPENSTQINNPEIWMLVKRVPHQKASMPFLCNEWKAVAPNTTYTVYHVRRNDLLRKKNDEKYNNTWLTSVENVVATYKRQYPSKAPGPMIYMTDEQDPTYIAALEAGLAAINPDVTRGDHLFPSCHNDNMCIFCNLRQLKEHATRQIKFGKH